MEDTQRWQRVMAVFDAVIEHAVPQRAALLDALCAGDGAVRREVETLLAHDSLAADGFLAPPDAPTDLRAWFDESGDVRVGATVAGYRLVEVIASGGMGTVYRARQDKLQRDVAIKLIRPSLASATALRRFEHEARFLARLRHPNIAQIFEAGTFPDPATGATIPYFVMELVENPQPITRYCGAGFQPAPDADKMLAPQAAEMARPPTGMGGSESLALRDRLELFLQVCDAVHHGHQRGLIHRDLKPGNILVDAAGRAKVIDFGVARSTDADVAVTTMQTDSGQLVGTLQYMSPEQCAADAADLDVRSDVYALGVVLYELVCGQPPYDLAGATLIGAARIVCERTPAPPRQFNTRLSRDLEAILLKCLEKDRTRRYQSAAQLADDLRRHLAGDTITARPPGRYRRVVRWVSRHAIAATAMACTSMFASAALATLIGLHWTGKRPNNLWISDDSREIQIETIAEHRIGPILRGSGKQSICALPDFQSYDGKRLAIVGIRHSDSDAIGPGLYAFDAAVGLTADGVKWRSSIHDGDFPPPPPGRTYTPGDFTICDLRLVDVFDEPAGPELLTVWSHETWSWRALIIYDLEGLPRYRIWHDGTIELGQVQWLPKSGILVVAGTYGTHDMWRINRQLPSDQYAVPVVFAVRPEPDQLESKLIAVPERPEWIGKSKGMDTANGPRVQPVWYKFVWPLNRRFLVRPTDNSTNALPLRVDGSAIVSIELLDQENESLGGINWLIDDSGDPASVSSGGDEYNRSLESEDVPLPPANQFRLVDLETLVNDPFGEIYYGTATDLTPPP